MFFVVFSDRSIIVNYMEHLDKNDSWMPDLELFPLGRKLDDLGAFVCKLTKLPFQEEKGAESMLERLQDANLSGFGYQDET